MMLFRRLRMPVETPRRHAPGNCMFTVTPFPHADGDDQLHTTSDNSSVGVRNAMVLANSAVSGRYSNARLT